MAKKRTPDFGKRGREQAGPGVARVTVVQRLKTLGARYLHATGLAKKSPCEQERLQGFDDRARKACL